MKSEPTPVRFDRILARNVLGRGADKAARIAALAGLLAPGGVLVLAEPAPRLGERLLADHDWTGLPEELVARIVAAEARVYADPEDPMVNWDDGDLATWCAAAGLTVTRREVARGLVEFPLTRELAARWFGAPGRQSSAQPAPGAAKKKRKGGKADGNEETGAEQGTASLGRLRALLGDEDTERARQHLEATLAQGGALRRKIAVALLAAQAPSG